MKKISKLPKKILSLFIAVLMIVSSMPFTAFARDTGLAEADPYWTRVASSNFDATTGVNNATANNLYNLNESPVIKSGDSAMTWGVCDYANASSSDGTGLYVDDGYIVLTGYNGGTTTPVTGKANFKIDVELEWTYENSNANSQRYCTLQLANGTALGKTSATMGSNASNIIAQDYYGKVYIGTTGYGTDGTSNCISPYSANLTTGKKYHYIMTYANKTLKTYVTDENYTVMQDVCTVENVPIDTSAINSICLGDDDSSYYFKNTKYHSITFYEGKTTSVKTVDTTNSKYLFAYFTGNASNDESLHLAVSTDGLQWKTLNKNFPVWNGTAATSIYPDNSGVAATTHIRDPYIMRAQDGSYYVFATDLDTQGGTNWGNNSKMHIFKASSLTAFKDNSVEHWEIDMQSTMASVLGGNTVRTWAPQAIYDPEYGQYMLYWSAATDSYSTTSMYYVYTTDFKSFTTTPKRLISPIGAGDNGDLNQANIDGDIYYNGQFYYLWYKNEATKSLAVMTSESPSGPYTNLKAFSYSQNLEGPQIYQLQDNQYVLLADAYNNYHFRAFLSDTVDGFTAETEINDSTTNINTLQPRHGAVIQIDDTEYTELVNKYGIDAGDRIVRYEFSLDHNFPYPKDGDYGTSDDAVNRVKDERGYKSTIWEGNQYHFDVGYGDEIDGSDFRASAVTGNGKAIINRRNLFINDTNVRSIIQNPTFTFSFKFKLTQNPSDKNPVIFATCNTTTDFVRLLEDGTFSVNGKDCTNKANIVAGEEHTYTIAYSGVDETAILLQDGNLVGAIATGPMDNTGAQFVGLGFSDAKADDGRIYGEYSALTFQKTIPDAVKTKLEENIVDESATKIAEAKGNLSSDDVNNKSVETFNKPSYYFDAIATDTYQNVLYSSSGDNMKYVYGTKGWATHYFYYPNYLVNVYDGDKKPTFGVVYKVNSTDRSSWTNRINCQDDLYEITQKFKGGSTDSIYSNFKEGTDTIGFTNKDDPSDELIKNNTYYYWSKFEYKGTGNTTDYYDYINSHKIYYHMSAYFRVDQDETVSGEANHYVINYEPLRDIISGDVTASPTWGGNYTFKELYKEIQKNGDRAYTTESIVKYYEAVNEIVAINVNESFKDANDTNVSDKVTTVAAQIKKAVEDYDKAVKGLTRQYKVTFKKAQLDGGQNVKIIYVNGNTATKASVTEAAPKNTARWYDNTYHYDYSWTINDVTSDIDIYENRTANTHSYTATTADDGEDRYKASTCTESGFYYNVCSCGYEYLVNTNPLGHDYQSTEGSTDSTLYKAATCTEDGFHKMICQTCGDTYTVIDGALDHDWGTGVSNGDGTHKQTCTRDSNHTQDLPCTMVENAEGTEATCSECGYTTTIVKLDRTAYNEALANANAVIANEKAKYSADSLSALQAVLVQAGKDALAVTTQDELDAVTARITAANSTDTENGGVLVPNTFRITYGNMFSFDDFMNSDSKNCATDSGKEKGTIGFDFANQVFTVTSNENYSDVYSMYGGADTYKIPVTAGKSYTFEYEVKGSTANQAFAFFYDSTGSQVFLDSSYAYTETENGVVKDRTASNGDYFVNKYYASESTRYQLTFTAPENCVSVDFRFGVTAKSTSASFYNIGFYESDMVENFVLADGVVYGTAFDELAIMSPDIDGMHFGGWFVDEALTTSASTLTEITRNVNLYAKLDALKVKEVVGCTLLKHGYTTYVCSDENCTTEVVYTSYDDQILDGSAFFPANDAIQAIIDAEIANGYQNYTQASIEALAAARENLYNTTVNYHTQSEVDAAVTTMNNLVSNLVVKIYFVTKGDNEVESTQVVEVPYNTTLTAPTVNPYTTVDGRYTWNFTNWDNEVVTSNVTTSATYVAQYTKTDNTDLSAYNAAVALAKESIANTAKYTETSRNELQAVITANQYDENSTQAQIDAMAKAIEEANKLVADGGKLVLMQYTIVLHIYDEDKDSIITENAINETVDYGTIREMNLDLLVPAEIKDNYSVVSWKRVVDTEQVIKGVTNTTLNAVVYQNVIYYAVIKNIAPTGVSEDTVVATLNNKSNKPVDINYVQKGTNTVTIENSEITITNTADTSKTVTLVAPSYSFYKVTGFTVNGKTVATDSTVEVTENIVIKPIYTPTIDYTIELGDGIYTTVGKKTGKVEMGWDKRITVTTDTATDNTAWYYQYEYVENNVTKYSEPKLSGYGKTFSMQVTQNGKITCQDSAQAVPMATIEHLSYGGFKAGAISAVGRYYLPDGYEFVSAGVILKSVRQLTAEDTMSQDAIDALAVQSNYLVTNSGGVYTAKTFVDNTNQYLINVNLQKEYYAMNVGAVTFVQYKETSDGEVKTAYSDVMLYNYSQSVTQN